MQAACDLVCASVVVGMMSTYEGLLDHNIVSHTWMLFPAPELARTMDWTDAVACRAPSPLMVQYDEDDELFSIEGMRAADRRIADRYREAGGEGSYVGRFYPGPHKFDCNMQEDAFNWLEDKMQG